MAEFHPYRQAAQQGAPADNDRLLVYLAQGFSLDSDGLDDTARNTREEDNLPQTFTLESLRTYFQTGGQAASSFLALTDTPSAFGTTGQYLAVNSASNALEFVDAPSATQAETGESIVSKLDALTGNGLVDYRTNLFDTLRGAIALTELHDTDTTFFAYDASSPEGVEVSLRTLKTNILAAETGATIVTKLSALTGEARLDAAAIKNLPEPQDGGLTSVHTDATLSGLGTQASPLAVANPFTAADELKLDGISAGAEVNVQADWNATSGDAVILNKPTTITQAQADKLAGIEAGAEVNQSAAQIVTALEALTGAARLSYSALDGAPAIPAVETGATIVSKLEGLSGAARLDYSALDNTPAIPAAPTTSSVTALLRAFPALTSLANEDTLFAYDASSSQGVEITLQSLASYVEGTLTIPDAEVDEFQFAVATISQDLQSDDALGNAIAGATVGKDLSFANTRDAASLGFTDASGRLSFGNTHTDRDTNLIITGRIAIEHTGLGGRLRVLFREFLATDADTVNREVEVANHPITESASLRFFHLPVTGTQVRVRRGRTYKVFVEFTAEAGAAANGQVSIVYTLNDAANLIAFNRFQLRLTDLIDTPASLGTAGQVLAVSSGGNLLEWVDATSEATAVELFSTLREANALTALADTDTLFGWDASASNGVEISLATLKAFINEGEGDDSDATFLSLTDTPSAFVAGQYLRVNSASNALEFVAAPSSGIGDNLMSANVAVQTTSTSFAQVSADIGFRMESDTFYVVEIFNHLAVNIERIFWMKFSGSNSELLIDAENVSDANTFIDFRNGASGNTSAWVRRDGEGARNIGSAFTIQAIREFSGGGSSSGGATTFTALTDTPDALGSAGQIPAVNAGGDALEWINAPSGGSGGGSTTFPAVAALPAATEFNQTADLTHLDASNNAPPGLYRTINNPVTMRNRTIATIGVDPLQGNIYGFSLDPANTWGHVDNAGMVGKLVWSTAVPRYCNIGLNVARTGSARTEVYIDFGSSEFGTDITRRIRFNRGTTSGNFTRGGITYRDWTVDTTELDQSSDEVVQRLMELQDASGDNDITIDVYETSVGGVPLNHLPAFVWEGLLSQNAQQPFLEQENKSNRILRAERIFGDNNRLRSYETHAAAIADGVLLEDDLVFKVRNKTPGSAEDISQIFTVDGAVAGSGGTRGSVSHRNRFSALMLAMGNNGGFYYTAQYRSALRAFNNVQNADDIDPNNHIVWMSFYDSGGAGNRPYVDIGIDPELTTSNTISMLIMNRETSRRTDAPQLDIELTRTGQTGTFGGKTGNGYRYTLNATQASALGTAGWLFKSDTVIVDFVMDILRSESRVNINPDEVQFTSGTGYVAPTGAIASITRSIGASWTEVFQSTARTQTSAWTLTTDIADSHEVYLEWEEAGTGDRRRATQFIVGPPQAGSEYDYFLRGRFSSNITEYFFSKQTESATGVIDRVIRSGGDLILYRVMARF